MQTEDKTPIYLSIFKRKGGEGSNTIIVNDNKSNKYIDLLIKLDENEKALLISYTDETNWFVFSNNKTLVSYNGVIQAVYNSDIIEVKPALEEELKDRIMNKEEFTKLKIKTKNDDFIICKLEKGNPYKGIYQVLHFIMSNNVKK